MAKRLPTLVVIAAFHEEDAAQQAAKTLDESDLVYTNLAIITKDKKGKVTIRGEDDASVYGSAATGAVIGGLACCLLGPVGIAAGASAGAAMMAAGASQIEGLDKNKLNQLGDVLQAGNSAIIAVFEEVVVAKKAFHEFDAERDELVYQLTADIGKTLRNHQDVTYLLSLEEERLVAARKAMGPDAVNIASLVVTADGATAKKVDMRRSLVGFESVATDWTDVQVERGVVTKDGAVIVDAQAKIE